MSALRSVHWTDSPLRPPTNRSSQQTPPTPHILSDITLYFAGFTTLTLIITNIIQIPLLPGHRIYDPSWLKVVIVSPSCHLIVVTRVVLERREEHWNLLSLDKWIPRVYTRMINVVVFQIIYNSLFCQQAPTRDEQQSMYCNLITNNLLQFGKILSIYLFKSKYFKL